MDTPWLATPLRRVELAIPEESGGQPTPTPVGQPPVHLPQGPLPLEEQMGVASETDTATPVLEVKGLRKHFSVRSAANPLQATVIPAVDGVSFALGTACTTAVVGESGSGKSTLARPRFAPLRA